MTKIKEYLENLFSRNFDPSTGLLSLPANVSKTGPGLKKTENIDCSELLTHSLASIRNHGKKIWAKQHEELLKTKFREEQELNKIELSELLLILKAVNYKIEASIIEKRFQLAIKYSDKTFGGIKTFFEELEKV
jgi:S-adenosylmethionine hydrolase